MPSEELSCWKCGASLNDTPLPLSRLAKCKACRADLHVCRICKFYDPTVNKSCREPIAEEVKDKIRANFCGYLTPSPNAYVARDDTKVKASQSDLNALFGLKRETDDYTGSQEEESKQKLEELFGIDKKKS